MKRWEEEKRVEAMREELYLTTGEGMLVFKNIVTGGPSSSSSSSSAFAGNDDGSSSIPAEELSVRQMPAHEREALIRMQKAAEMERKLAKVIQKNLLYFAGLL
jgi:hypothetical protein